MTAMQIADLLMVAVAGTLVALCRDTVRQVMLLSAFGLLMALLFFTLQAPDVGLSQIVIGAIALPVLLLLAIAKVRHDQPEKKG